MGDVNIHAVKTGLCPECGHLWEIAYSGNEVVRPDDGALGVCFGCGLPLRFVENDGVLGMEPMSDEQVNALSPEECTALCLMLLQTLETRTRMRAAGIDPDGGNDPRHPCGTKH